MPDHTSFPKMPNGRRRSERAHQAILDAATTLLDEEGYRTLSMDAIAARAGVGRQTIYRWWPNKAAVVLEAFAERTRRQIPELDTGVLEDDLVAFLEAWLRVMRGTAGAALRGLLAEALTDPEFAQLFRKDYLPARRDLVRHLLLRGQGRGELPGHLDVEFVNDLLFGPVWYRFMLYDTSSDPNFARTVVRHVLMGVRQAE